MKTFVVQKSMTMCAHKREIRDPVITDLNEKPRDDYRAVHVAQSMARPASFYDPFESPMNMTMERHIFESHRLITMIWVEDHQAGDTSMGYYNSFISYFQVPEGTDAGEIFGVQEGEDIYSRMGTEPRIRDEMYYRHRLQEVEQRLRQSEMLTPTPTPVLEPFPEPEPKPRVQHFDETIFELE